jgi:hypothetical protein
MRLALGRRHRRLRLALAAVCIGMLVVIGAELRASEPNSVSSAAAERRSPRVNALAPESFTMPPPGTFAEVLARPLFSPARRPGAQAGALAASSSFTLVGIVLAPEDRRALLGVGQPMKIVRVREGQDIGGWVVEAILPNKVIVRRADLREEVKAKDFARGASAGARPAATAAVVSEGARMPVRRPAHDE